MATATAAPEGLVAASTGRRGWVLTLGRLGIGARGVIYLILAYLALDIARHGNAPTQATSTGALEEVRRRSGGSELLVLLAVGLGSYAIWRLLNAMISRPGALKRLGSLAIAVIYFGLLARALELAAGHSANGGAAANPEPLVVKVMGWPAGREIVGICGAAFLIAGVGLGLWGILHRSSTNLDLGRVTQGWRRTVRALEALGDLARGFLLASVGAYLIGTAASDNPSQAKGIDQALKALVGHPYGAILIGTVALGLFCFGAYSFFDAWLRRL